MPKAPGQRPCHAPAPVDWTTVGVAAISAGSAVVGSALGYLTALRSSGVEIRKAEEETERLRLQHGEEHLRHRQAIYHDFLDSAHRYHQAVGDVEPFPTPADYTAWRNKNEHDLSAVSLFGTERAWRAAQELDKAMQDALDAFGDPGKYSGPLEDNFMKCWEDVVVAMRLDTAPPESD